MKKLLQFLAIIFSLYLMNSSTCLAFNPADQILIHDLEVAGSDWVASEKAANKILAKFSPKMLFNLYENPAFLRSPQAQRAAAHVLVLSRLSGLDYSCNWQLKVLMEEGLPGPIKAQVQMAAAREFSKYGRTLEGIKFWREQDGASRQMAFRFLLSLVRPDSPDFYTSPQGVAQLVFIIERLQGDQLLMDLLMNGELNFVGASVVAQVIVRMANESAITLEQGAWRIFLEAQSAATQNPQRRFLREAALLSLEQGLNNPFFVLRLSPTERELLVTALAQNANGANIKQTVARIMGIGTKDQIHRLAYNLLRRISASEVVAKNVLARAMAKTGPTVVRLGFCDYLFLRFAGGGIEQDDTRGK